LASLPVHETPLDERSLGIVGWEFDVGGRELHCQDVESELAERGSLENVDGENAPCGASSYAQRAWKMQRADEENLCE
jgi:hypothetical protein